MTRAFRFLSGSLILAGLFAAPPAITASTGTAATDDLKVGDQAPDFSLPGSDGKTYSLAQLKGKTVVLAWFPMAFTGG